MKGTLDDGEIWSTWNLKRIWFILYYYRPVHPFWLHKHCLYSKHSVMRTVDSGVKPATSSRLHEMFLALRTVPVCGSNCIPSILKWTKSFKVNTIFLSVHRCLACHGKFPSIQSHFRYEMSGVGSWHRKWNSYWNWTVHKRMAECERARILITFALSYYLIFM